MVYRFYYLNHTKIAPSSFRLISVPDRCVDLDQTVYLRLLAGTNPGNPNI